jgi:hypothetical protein
LYEEQAGRLRIYRRPPCIFLIEQAKYRDSAGPLPRGRRIGPPATKNPAVVSGPRAQFQLWIFSYTIGPRSSKKLLSRLMIVCAVAA